MVLWNSFIAALGPFAYSRVTFRRQTSYFLLYFLKTDAWRALRFGQRHSHLIRLRIVIQEVEVSTAVMATYSL